MLPPDMKFREQIEAAAKAHGLMPELVAAVVTVESNFDPWARRFEPKWHYWFGIEHLTEPFEHVTQQTSWGLMQVMGAVARELGHAKDLHRLCDPELGLRYGCMKLRQLAAKYSDLERTVAAYNAGVPGTAPGAAYAAKVMNAMRPLIKTT